MPNGQHGLLCRFNGAKVAWTRCEALSPRALGPPGTCHDHRLVEGARDKHVRPRGMKPTAEPLERPQLDGAFESSPHAEAHGAHRPATIDVDLELPVFQMHGIPYLLPHGAWRTHNHVSHGGRTYTVITGRPRGRARRGK